MRRGGERRLSVLPTAGAVLGIAFGVMSRIELPWEITGSMLLSLTFAAAGAGALAHDRHELLQTQTPIVAGLLSWFAVCVVAAMYAPRQLSIWLVALGCVAGWRVTSASTTLNSFAVAFVVVRGLRLFVALSF